MTCSIKLWFFHQRNTQICWKVSKVTLTQAFSETWMTSFLLCSSKKRCICCLRFLSFSLNGKKNCVRHGGLFTAKSISSIVQAKHRLLIYFAISEVCKYGKNSSKIGDQTRRWHLVPHTHAKSRHKNTLGLCWQAFTLKVFQC